MRTIAKRTGLDRKTVRRHVETAQGLGLSRGDTALAVDDAFVGSVVSLVRPGGATELGAMRAHCRQHRALIEGWLLEGCKGPKLVRLVRRQTGVTVPLRTMQRFVREDLGVAVQDTVRVVDPKPGVLEMDFLTLGSFVDRASEESPSLTHVGSPGTGGLEPHEPARPVRIVDPHGPCSEGSAWVDAYRTFWTDPGPDWDEGEVAAFLACAAR